MSSLPEPKHHDLSLAEAISFLAWGRMFSTHDFIIADGYIENCRWLSIERGRLSLLESRFSELHPKSSEPPHEQIKSASDTPPENGETSILNRFVGETIAGDDPDNAQISAHMNTIRTLVKEIENLDELASLWQSCSKEIQRHEAAVRAAEVMIPQMEDLEGGERYGSNNFLSGSLTKATLNLWDAIAKKTVKMHAKLDRNASAWEEVPATWFWGEPKPECYLESACVRKSDSSSKAPDEVTCWYDVRFERPEIENLYKQLIEAPIQEPPSKNVPKIVIGSKNPGGRPQKYDWDAFWIEIVRIADMDNLPQKIDGPQIDKARLTTIMKTWCSRNWDEEPSDALIRNKIAKIPSNWPASGG